MKIPACLLVLCGALLLLVAAGQEMSGHAIISPPARYEFISGTGISRAKDPAGFRNAMFYNWVDASLTLGAGLFLLSLVRRQDRLDPFSPSFQGRKEIDELDDSSKDRDS
jgi:hypothetical protein